MIKDDMKGQGAERWVEEFAFKIDKSSILSQIANNQMNN